MGTQLPAPQFSAHVYCDQTAGWIKTEHGTEVGLGKGAEPPPQFSAHFCCGQTEKLRCHLVWR